jgi:hypothetical protein
MVDDAARGTAAPLPVVPHFATRDLPSQHGTTTTPFVMALHHLLPRLAEWRREIVSLKVYHLDLFELGLFLSKLPPKKTICYPDKCTLA